ncbi:hypothetical protein ACP4OV_017895 [Aristida adscensionis]
MAAATPADPEAAAAMDNGWNWNLPVDAFVEILQRLPPIRRRRLRLACRHWRDVIDERAPPPRPSRPMALAYVTNTNSGWASAYVVEDLHEGRCRKLPWTFSEDRGMVGTCNGLLCLCDNSRRGGAIVLLNPATGEKLAAPPPPPPPPCHGRGIPMYGWHEAYSFAYKVVHVPCYLDRAGGFNAVQVLTPGEAPAAAWRDVPTPGATCLLDAGLVSVDGATYWLARDAGSVAKLDLREERVASTAPVPAAAAAAAAAAGWKGRSRVRCHLTEVQGRLGLAVVRSNRRTASERVEVWVLGSGGDRRGWSRRLSVQVDGDGEPWRRQRLARPHMVHGDYVLTTESRGGQEFVLGYRMSDAGSWLRSTEVRTVRIGERMPAAAVSGMEGYLHGTFAYVPTMEPLSPYKL